MKKAADTDDRSNNIYIMFRRKSFSNPHARTDRTPVIQSVAHVVHHHTILVKVAFRLSYE